MKVRKQTKLWQTRDGTKIRICDMTDQHLLNALHFLERAATTAILHIPYPTFGGEQAQYYAEEGWNDLCQYGDTEEFYPIYGNLWLECERRGLETA